MILIDKYWEKVNNLSDVSRIIREYYNSELADELERLVLEDADDEDEDEDFELEFLAAQNVIYNLEYENGNLQDRIGELEDIIEDLQAEIEELKLNFKR